MTTDTSVDQSINKNKKKQTKANYKTSVSNDTNNGDDTLTNNEVNDTLQLPQQTNVSTNDTVDDSKQENIKPPKNAMFKLVDTTGKIIFTNSVIETAQVAKLNYDYVFQKGFFLKLLFVTPTEAVLSTDKFSLFKL